MKRSVSPLSRATSLAQAIGRAVKVAAAANAIARSASPRSALVGDWTDPKKLKEIAKDLQRQLQRKESDALRLNDRVQKLVALRDEQLIESQAERKRLHYALEQEEVEALAALMDFIIFHWGEVWWSRDKQCKQLCASTSSCLPARGTDCPNPFTYRLCYTSRNWLAPYMLC